MGSALFRRAEALAEIDRAKATFFSGVAGVTVMGLAVITSRT